MLFFMSVRGTSFSTSASSSISSYGFHSSTSLMETFFKVPITLKCVFGTSCVTLSAFDVDITSPATVSYDLRHIGFVMSLLLR